MSLTQSPLVSFVVPCYKLGHLLPECLQSILSQTHHDLEILVMDDCSPDNTTEVARSFTDPRVRYVRNEQNLGHLANYNKGIGLSRGKYVWLISADDYLRAPYVVERYVDVAERHPNIGYVFCPAYGVRDGVETRVMGRYSQRRDVDRIFRGDVLLRRLLQSNFAMTPSGMVRRECYHRISVFPPNMPWCGDWYLWCLFALHYDVAYFAEPMVCYREHHDLSMTTQLSADKLDACVAEEIAVVWMIRQKALEAGYVRLARQCLSAIGHTYGRVMATPWYRNARFFMNFDAFEASLGEYAENHADRDVVRAQTLMCIGNEYYWQEDFNSARRFYSQALERDPWMVTVRLKNTLLALGKPGHYVRRTLLAYR